MSSEPAEILHPLRLVRSQVVLEGELPLSKMERLSKVLHAVAGSANYKLRFAPDEQGRPCVEEHLEANVILTCQRCLEPVSVEIMTDNVLGIINNNDDADDLPSEYEPLLVSTGKLNLSDLIEDELLLALPMAPAHPIEECPVKIEPVDLNIEKRNPFADIKHLQMKNRSDK